MAQTIAPQVTDQVPENPPMWRGGPQLNSSGMDPYGPPENWAMGTPPSAAGPEIGTEDIVDPFGSQSGIERLGAAYHIRANLPYSEPTNWQPTRASEFYGWTTGR